MAYKRQNGKRSSPMAYIPLAAVLVLIIVIFGVSVFFRVTVIEVTGGSRYTADEIIAASGIQTGDNLFLINSDAVWLRIKASKPYISSVRIERRIPDVAVITVTESVAFAVLMQGNDCWIIDSTGRILGRTDFAGTEGLIRVSGLSFVNPKEGAQVEVSDNYSTQLGYMLDIFKAIHDAGMSRDITNLDITNISAISFVYKGGVNVRFGGGENAAKKLERLADALKDKPDDFRGQVLLDRDDQTSVLPAE